MNVPAVLVGVLLVGLVVGAPIGFRVAQARRAYYDWKKTKDSLPGLRKDMWFFSRRASGGVVFALLTFILFALAAANGGDAGS